MCILERSVCAKLSVARMQAVKLSSKNCIIVVQQGSKDNLYASRGESRRPPAVRKAAILRETPNIRGMAILRTPPESMSRACIQRGSSGTGRSIYLLDQRNRFGSRNKRVPGFLDLSIGLKKAKGNRQQGTGKR